MWCDLSSDHAAGGWAEMGEKGDGGQKEGRVDQRPGPASQRASWACFAARHGPASQRVTVEHAQHVSLRSSFSSGVYKCPLYLRRNTFFKFQCSKLQTDRQTLRWGIAAFKPSQVF